MYLQYSHHICKCNCTAFSGEAEHKSGLTVQLFNKLINIYMLILFLDGNGSKINCLVEIKSLFQNIKDTLHILIN